MELKDMPMARPSLVARALLRGGRPYVPTEQARRVENLRQDLRDVLDGTEPWVWAQPRDVRDYHWPVLEVALPPEVRAAAWVWLRDTLAMAWVGGANGNQTPEGGIPLTAAVDAALGQAGRRWSELSAELRAELRAAEVVEAPARGGARPGAGAPRTTGRGAAQEVRFRPSDEERSRMNNMRRPGETDAELVRRALDALDRSP